MKNTSQNLTAFIGGIFTLLGALMLTISGNILDKEQKFIERARVTQGTVIELAARRSSKGGTTYYPIVEFTDHTGQKTKIGSSYSSNPAAYEVGETVDVYYEPGKTSEAEIKGFFHNGLVYSLQGLWGLSLVSSALRICFFLKIQAERKMVSPSWQKN